MKRLIPLLLLLLFTTLAGAEETVWKIMNEDETLLTQICYQPVKGDQYISGDDVLYEIVRVDGETAYARSVGSVELPDVSWLDADTALPVSALEGRAMALYCTHSDESYEPSDGQYSDEKRGSIYQVAEVLADALREKGVEVQVSDNLHYPHDAGAYRRSRQTAVQLMKTMPDALLDVHRDGIPDPEEYTVTIGGKDCSKIRLLVGRGNQNMEVNKDFALKIKAVANKVYPGLIKDIYMGKGTYNQDLAPHCLLLECGTYTISKERVMTSMPMMADVLYRAMYGGIKGSAGMSDTSDVNRTADGGITPGATDAPVEKRNKGASAGMTWLVVILVGGLIVFGILSSGSLKGGMGKAGRHLSEMTGGLLGKKPKDHEDPPHS